MTSVTSIRLLDADILIDVFRQYPPALTWFANRSDVLYAPGFALMELIGGCRNNMDLRLALNLPKIVPPVWPSLIGLQQGYDLFARYCLSHNLGLLDALIAATALEYGATLCTFNVKHFSAVPGLITEQPYSRT